MQSRRGRIAGLLAPLLMVPVAVVGPAAGSAHAAGQELAPVMIVLDASGSMNATAGGKQTKISAAKSAVRSLVSQAPDGAELGLEVYGEHTGSAAADKAKGCWDITIEHPVGPVDKAALDAAVNRVRARGYTPIGAALKKAAAGLPKSGHRSIVLVSDGLDTCAPPDPCAVAKELHKQGVDLRVDTIGLAVDDKARSQLSCIAHATGGSYTDSPGTAQLGPALQRTTQVALRNYQPAGKPIDCASGTQNAPVMKPGQYIDSVAFNGTTNCAVDLPKGYTAYVGVTGIYPADPRSSDAAWNQDSFDVSVKNTAGTDCGVSSTGNEPQLTDTHDQQVVSTGLVFGTTDACPVPGRFVVQVHRNSPHAVPKRPVTFEFVVGLEPPVRKGATLPAARTMLATAGSPKQPAVAASGGGSFGQAGTLPTKSGNYSDTVRTGETVFYRVRLGWGQSLAYTVSWPGLGQHLIWPSATLYTPFRTRVGHSDWGFANGVKDKVDKDASLATPAIEYDNRKNQDNGQIRACSIAGWYYIGVHLNSKDHPGTPYTATIHLTVSGTRHAAPAYRGSTAHGIFGQNTAGDSTAPSKKKAAPSSSASASPRQLASDQGDSTLWYVLGPLLGAVAAGVLATVVLMARRPRR